jgi:hypothetical protein
LSTSPFARPISCTVSKVRSPSIFAAFFGHAIQRPSAGSRVALSPPKRRSRSSRLVVKKTTTPAPGFAPSFCESGVPE